MTNRILVDTGPLVALLDRRDRAHSKVVELSLASNAQLVSVEGVLIEASHLLRRVPRSVHHLIELVQRIKVAWVPMNDARLKAASALISKYHDVEMDLVDALLLLAAHELNITQIWTLDRRGFQTSRTPGGVALEIV